MNWIAIGIILGAVLLVEGRDEMDARIVAAYSTKTAYSITTSTTTVPLTCASAANGAVCLKRRYRRYNVLQMFNEQPDQNMTQLEGSIKDDTKLQTGKEEDQDVLKSEDGERKPRIAITVWTTRSSTYTVTSTSVNSSTTLSLSYYCTISGANLAPACG